jgi:polyisoprenoid-binding protein YceI
MSNQSWKVDDTHSSIHFSVRHMVVSKVKGSFERWTSELAIDDSDLTRSSVSVTIDAASIETRTAQRDQHLRSADFLDVERFPHIVFKSKRIEREGEGQDRYRMIGDLTIKDVTREVTLDVEYSGMEKDPWGGQRAGFTAHTAVERKDFGLTWNLLLETGGVVVGDKISIDIEIEAVRQLADKDKEAA